ncbi:MAG: hypothetical protein LBR64_02260 [Dysgonamonadaceae bacterium]|jgi:hypothetical protein|nr:hypothetical protein [Dysgonamonadaceae bacterium]
MAKTINKQTETSSETTRWACRTCKFWKQVISEEMGFGNCRRIKVGEDVRISAYYLQTGEDFACSYHQTAEKPEEKQTKIENDGTIGNDIDN